MAASFHIAGRFAVEQKVGAGGMGTVYRALDTRTGVPVALKVLRAADDAFLDRFAREARVLSQIDHPAVVHYIAHGVTSGELPPDGALDAPAPRRGAPYLAMEWLEGEDLAARLARGTTSIAEGLAIARRMAGALAAVHARGIVHRDVKPSNLFLRGGMIADLVLLDFGIARTSLDDAARLTASGVIVGTPRYMAPEQARGERDVGPAADVFSLGCVLFRALTGRTPFTGSDVLEVLTKLVLEDAPRTRDLRPDTPAALDALIARMLAKDPAGRPADGTALAAALEALDEGDDTPTAPCAETAVDPSGSGSPSHRGSAASSTGWSPWRMADEQRLCSVLLVARTPGDTAGDFAVHETVGACGGRLQRLLDGTGVVLIDRGAATDQAAAAARCALALRRALPGCALALATGQAKAGATAPEGPTLERAVRLLREATSDGSIRIDELTAGLLDAGFEVEGLGSHRSPGPKGRLSLRGQRSAGGVARRVLGKTTTCVGRERELRALADLFDACASEPEARAVVIEGDAGVGKSRLREEALRAVQASRPGLEVWIARGDPMHAGTPFGLVGQLIRAAAGIGEGEPIERRRDKLRDWVARRCGRAKAPRVVEFLGELSGTPFPAEPRGELMAARQSPMLMGDQMRRAWVDLLDAETSRAPVVLVLEDLHWGDAPTVEHIDAALRLLKHRPLFVLALARPAVRDAFPRLWPGRSVIELRLGALSRRACEALARQILDAEVTAERAASLWEQSQGNAFFLEELIRADADGRGVGQAEPVSPPTVLAMLQSGIEALAPEARRVLRAASVFGQTFRQGGVAALLGDPPGLDAILADLTQREWLTEGGAGDAHVFRHALVREAAYGMLIDDDRLLGHRFAGAWLEETGEPNARVIAEHFDRGGEPARAVEGYRRAAEQALEGSDLTTAIALAERAATLGARSNTLAALHLVRAEAHSWRGEPAVAERWAIEAAALWPEGSDGWFIAVRSLVIVAGRLGHGVDLDALGARFVRLWEERPEAEVTAAQLIATEYLAGGLALMGRREQAVVLYAAAERVAARFMSDPGVAANVGHMRAIRATALGDLYASQAMMMGVVRDSEASGNLRSACHTRCTLAWTSVLLGAYDEAAALSRAVLDEAERLGLGLVAARARFTLALCQREAGDEEGARAGMKEAVLAFAGQGQRRFEGSAHARLAAMLHRDGDLEGAEQEARRAVALLDPLPALLPLALGHLSRVLSARGRAEEALAVAQRSKAVLDKSVMTEEGVEVTRLALAEALDAVGDRAGAAAAIADAAERLQAQAERIPDEALRESFLHRVPEHARTLALARAWSAVNVS